MVSTTRFRLFSGGTAFFMKADQGGGQIRFSVPDSHASL